MNFAKSLPSSLMTTLKSLAMCSLLILTNACELQDSPAPTKKPSTTNVLSYFFVTQWAIPSAPDLQAQLGSILGGVIVASSDSNFDAWEKPQLNSWTLSSAESFSVGVRRYVDLGDLKISGTGRPTLTVSRNATTFQFSESALLNPGALHLETFNAAKGAPVITQDFNVPAISSGVAYSVGSGAAASLPIPAIDQNAVATIDRTQAFNLGIQAGSDVDYVRITLADATLAADHTLVIYAPANQVVSIPPEALSHLAATATGESGAISIDFVSVSSRKDLRNIQESFVYSIMRHSFGGIPVTLSGTKYLLNMGRLAIQ